MLICADRKEEEEERETERQMKQHANEEKFPPFVVSQNEAKKKEVPKDNVYNECVFIQYSKLQSERAKYMRESFDTVITCGE